MTTDLDRRKLLYKIAKAYYDDDLTQGQIASRLGLSRIKVSRLLKQARDDGIVHIFIMPPPGTNADLERALEDRFGLLEAVVVTPASYSQGDVVYDLGPAAAEYLVRCLNGNEIVGLSWGTTLHAVVESLPARSWPDLLVVPISGGLGAPEWEVQGTDLTRRMAQSLGAGLRYLPAPGVVGNPLVRQALMEDPQVGETLATAAKADVVVLGIGVPRAGSVVARAGILTEEETRQFMRQGAVGDIALRFFDRDGRPMEHQVGQRTIGLTLDQIRRIPRRIGVAGGEGKFEVIRGALRGGLINVLVTDDRTAGALLEDAEPAARIPGSIQQPNERQGNHVALPVGA